MKKTTLFTVLILAGSLVFAQKKTTTSATINFDATTSIDNLPKAENKTAIGALDLQKGTVQFEAAVKNFAFSNPRIQEHFNNAQWFNSEEHPVFTFNGTITNLNDINFKKDGTYTANVEGVLAIKGKEGKISTPATIIVKGSAINANTEFSIKLSDYGISGVPIDAGKVSKEPKITVSAELK